MKWPIYIYIYYIKAVGQVFLEEAFEREVKNEKPECER